MPPAPTPGWRHRLRSEWLLLVFAGVAVVLALLDPQPLARYRHWLQWPTLTGLLGLLVAIQGIRDSGLVQHAAAAMTARVRTLRGLGLALVAATAVLSMVLTNDVSLFLVVPLTLAIGAASNLPVARMVVLEALAVNAGSALSPIGNPQNLLLWQHSGLSFAHFTLAMLPAATVMLAMVMALAVLWLPRERVALAGERPDVAVISGRLGAGSALALVMMVVLIEHDLAPLGAALVLVLFALGARASLRRVDWLLLATFAAIFLALGHAAALPVVDRVWQAVDLRQPSTVFVAAIAASQLLSNVPATVLLLDRAPDTIALAVAVNVGGFGAAIGSLANLIALRLARLPQGMRLLHAASVPFLLVAAPLAYAAWRWLG